MSNTNIIEQIKEVKELIKNKTFDEACVILQGFNRESFQFDYNYGDFVNTIYNEANGPVLGSMFDIYYEGNFYGTFELTERLDYD